VGRKRRAAVDRLADAVERARAHPGP
jgi:hypothetical protein